MTEITLTLTDMAHGGLALGRDKAGRAVFVPFAIPGETVRVRVPDVAGGRQAVSRPDYAALPSFRHLR